MKAVKKAKTADNATPHNIARAYIRARRESDNSPTMIGNRRLKRRTLPPFARPDALLKRDIYRLASEQPTDRFAMSRLIRRIRFRDEDYVVRFAEDSIVDWIIREVNWHPVRAARGFAPEDRIPLLKKEALSHLRVELNFAYRYAIKWKFVVPFIWLVGGFEVISARLAHDDYPLFELDWLSSMQDQRHPSFAAFEAAQRRHFGDDEDEDEVAPIAKSGLKALDDDWT